MKPVICSVTGAEIPMDACPECRGIGEVPSGHTDPWGRMTWRACGECEGTGRTAAAITDPRWAAYDRVCEAWAERRLTLGRA